MKKMKIYVVLCLVMAFMLNIVSYAATEDGKESKTNIEVDRRLKSIQEKGYPIVTKEASFDIKIPNLDLDGSITLMEQDKEINKSINTSVLMNEKYSKEQIEKILMVYPELSGQDFENWLYSRFQEYDTTKTLNKYEEVISDYKAELLKRNITLSDAIELIRYYGFSYNFLQYSDDELIEALTNIYLSKLEALDNIVFENNIQNEISINSSIKSYTYIPDNSTTYTTLNGLKYYKCIVPGYGSDWFLEQSWTHKEDNNIEYMAGLQLLYEAIYKTSNNFIASNMWGTYSTSAEWPHEGIDIVKGRNVKIYAPFSNDPTISGNATRRLTSNYYGRIVFDCGIGTNHYTLSFQHTGPILPGTSRITTTSFPAGTQIGTESGYGENSNQYDFGSHVHFSVKKGLDTSWDVYDSQLTSDNPYFFAFLHLD